MYYSIFMNNERMQQSMHRSAGREIKLDNKSDLQQCFELTVNIYEILRKKNEFIVNDTQHSTHIPHDNSRMNANMRFVLHDTALEDFDIVNPRKDSETGIKIFARTKNPPIRTINFSEINAKPEISLLQGAFFVDDTLGEYTQSKFEPVALMTDVAPWLLLQDGLSETDVKRIMETESDPLRFAADLLSKNAITSTHIEELRVDVNPDVIIGGQKIEVRHPNDIISKKYPEVTHYTLWTTSHYDTDEYGIVTERVVITFSYQDLLALIPDSTTTSIRVDIETEKALEKDVINTLVARQALYRADGKSVSLIDGLEHIRTAAIRLIEAPL